MAGPKRLLALVMAVPLFLAAACTTDNSSGKSDSGKGSSGGGGDLAFAVITHGSAGDAFWDVVQHGAEQAGKDLGISVDYQSDGDPQRQAQLIDAAVNQDVDGIVVSMANPDALKDSVEAAVRAGIPVVTINSGGERSAEFGAIGHVGQDESIAGQGAGGGGGVGGGAGGWGGAGGAGGEGGAGGREGGRDVGAGGGGGGRLGGRGQGRAPGAGELNRRGGCKFAL